MTYTDEDLLDGMATPPTYAARFGSWSEALNAAGLPTFDHD